MEGLKIHGYPLNHSKAVRGVIEDMRKTLYSGWMTLDMCHYAHWEGGTCHACAGGSAVIHGLNIKPEETWSDSAWDVANFYDDLRMGNFESMREGFEFPESAVQAWSPAMQDEQDPKFFSSWEKFADALEAHENSVAAALNGEEVV